MRAITFSAPIPRYLITLAAGRVAAPLYTGPHACTRLRHVPAPTLPSGRWVRIRTRLGGICGSDLAIVRLTSSPATSPFSSFPFVLGHESVGVVADAGPDVKAVAPGARVTVNPLLCCEPRGLDACDNCRAGAHQRCVRFTDGAVAPGMLIGTTRGVGGSWGEEFVAHESQVVAMPGHVSDAEAVLVEPLACVVQAVLAQPPAAGARVLVIGAGSIGLLTTAALRALAPSCRITVLARHAFQEDRARGLGASQVVRTRGDYLGGLADATGTRLLKPIIGAPIGVGGVDHTFLCITGRRGMTDAMRVTREGGSITVLGNVTSLNGVDWTPLWIKELAIRGSLTYGRHGHGSASRDAFREAAELIATRRVDARGLVTHTFPLRDYRKALAVAADKSSESVKVALTPD